MKKRLCLGRSPLHSHPAPVHGRQVSLKGQPFYRIANYDRMRPFLMSIVSGEDHWMFISSNGALTAGRRNPDLALFPYYTDDKIHDSAEITGSKTVIIAGFAGRDHLWEPFSIRNQAAYRIQRNLYKNFTGNQLIFEETNFDLQLTFRHGWFNSELFGFIRKAWLVNSASTKVDIRLLDGIQNLIPCGIGSQFQLEKSTLIDAYKKNELCAGTHLGLFTLSSVPVDRPEPAEALNATTIWSTGLQRGATLLSSVQLDRFRSGQEIQNETDVRAERGAYFVESTFTLRRSQTRNWLLAADVNQGPAEVAALNRLLRRPAQLRKSIEKDIHLGTEELRRIVATADGLQKSAQPLRNARHFNNVLFNIMRGGIFANGYHFDTADLAAFVRHANQAVFARNRGFFRRLGKTIERSALLSRARSTGNADLERLCYEYLPLTFSRRHGDPSRPWNRFSIATRGADRSRTLAYEGNWRDIFQNWEALAVSFPDYTSSMVCRFVNASTMDGYNPYRITRDGIDWEVIDPHDPWSHIGYWGDHQVIYLLKLLEMLDRHAPETLRDFLARDIFSYANVPYRIQPYEKLLEDPKETVVFDTKVDELTRQRVRSAGSDGKLVWDAKGRVRLVNLTEKLLVSLLAKFSNFVPGAGIWLNTQRPEWNDANNALVGNGASMVTVYYLRRYLAFCIELFRQLECSDLTISAEVARSLQAIHQILRRHLSSSESPLDDSARRRITDELGRAGSRYRANVYAHGFSGRKTRIKTKQLLDFFDVALRLIDKSIEANRRPDGLYHAYNLIKLGDRRAIPIRRLYEMLEGQVAVLSSGKLSATESRDLLLAMKRSALHRPDQHSYLLYPNRNLARFVEKNNISRKDVARSRLLKQVLADGDRLLVEQDVAGVAHFSPAIKNSGDAKRILGQLAAAGYDRLVRKEAPLVLEIFERLFDHQSFTGRSGTFFGYEGLGCIYWHMVSKLLLAVQETFFRAVDAGTPRPLLGQLADCYHDIRAGIGDYKSPASYGAFPMDPYSHTPAHTGARQPGLTGQVKEDILCRIGELGVKVRNGRISFEPRLLQKEEFLVSPAEFDFYDLTGAGEKLKLSAGSLAFTYCQVPVIYQLAIENSLHILSTRGSSFHQKAPALDMDQSRSILNRTGDISLITVSLTPNKIPGFQETQ